MHAGGLLDLEGKGGLRIHFHISVSNNDKGEGIDATFETENMDGKKFDVNIVKGPEEKLWALDWFNKHQKMILDEKWKIVAVNRTDRQRPLGLRLVDEKGKVGKVIVDFIHEGSPFQRTALARGCAINSINRSTVRDAKSFKRVLDTSTELRIYISITARGVKQPTENEDNELYRQRENAEWLLSKEIMGAMKEPVPNLRALLLDRVHGKRLDFFQKNVSYNCEAHATIDSIATHIETFQMKDSITHSECIEVTNLDCRNKYLMEFWNKRDKYKKLLHVPVFKKGGHLGGMTVDIRKKIIYHYDPCKTHVENDGSGMLQANHYFDDHMREKGPWESNMWWWQTVHNLYERVKEIEIEINRSEYWTEHWRYKEVKNFFSVTNDIDSGLLVTLFFDCLDRGFRPEGQQMKAGMSFSNYQTWIDFAVRLMKWMRANPRPGEIQPEDYNVPRNTRHWWLMEWKRANPGKIREERFNVQRNAKHWWLTYEHIEENDWDEKRTRQASRLQAPRKAKSKNLGNTEDRNCSKCECKEGRRQCDHYCANWGQFITCNDWNCSYGKSGCSNRRHKDPQIGKCKVQRWEREGGGYELVAKETIQKDKYIGQYVGIVKRRENANRKSKYRMELEVNGTDYIIDAEEKGNWTRFMNHSHKPNCEDRILMVDGRREVWFVSLEDIPAGTPLTFDYSWGDTEFPSGKCLCGQCPEGKKKQATSEKRRKAEKNKRQATSKKRLKTAK